MTDPLTPPVSRAAIAEDGPVTVSVQANEDQCQALAQRFGLLDLADLSADVTVTAIDGPGVRVTGHLQARTTQPCVVTHSPVTETVVDDFALRLMPEAKVVAIEEEVIMDPDADELDVLDSDDVDLSEIIAQSLSLALNAYPRAPGAELPDAVKPDTQNDQDDPAMNPFAVLKNLKDDP